MSKNVILVLMYHHHKPSDQIQTCLTIINFCLNRTTDIYPLNLMVQLQIFVGKQFTTTAATISNPIKLHKKIMR
jgi:hypothetical protein